jgi:hypothetical protein
MAKWRNLGLEMNVDLILDFISHYPLEVIEITGGEPFLHPKISYLRSELNKNRRKTIIRTARQPKSILDNEVILWAAHGRKKCILQKPNILPLVFSDEEWDWYTERGYTPVQEPFQRIDGTSRGPQTHTPKGYIEKMLFLVPDYTGTGNFARTCSASQQNYAELGKGEYPPLWNNNCWTCGSPNMLGELLRMGMWTQPEN